MDKSCHSADSSTTTTSGSSGVNANPTTTTTTRDHHLSHLNKLSHKISKPTSVPLVKKPTFDSTHLGQTQAQSQNQPVSVQPQPQLPVQSQSNLPAQQHQPPVYNINKNDFRDVVQKLTGSPAHERVSAPPPPTIQPTKPQSSRLQRFRPPPLGHVSNRLPPLLNCARPILNPSSQPNPPIPAPTVPIANFVQRPAAPLSPLPPFPTVHAAAESPISAYMRILQNSISTVDSNPNQFSGFMPLAPLVSPRWNNLAAPQQPLQPPPLQPQQGSSSGTTQSQLPSSLLPFGCYSPRSPYPLLSPRLLFSPNSGQLGLPLSPTVPVPSPTWKGL